MSRNRNRKPKINADFSYEVEGVLTQTPSNHIPVELVVDGKFKEICHENGVETVNRKGGHSRVLFPNDIKGYGFLGSIPLGSKVVFKESGTRTSGKKNRKKFFH